MPDAVLARRQARVVEDMLGPSTFADCAGSVRLREVGRQREIGRVLEVELGVRVRQTTLRAVP